MYRDILPTRHYLDMHEWEVPWDKVIEIMISTKNPRKSKDVYEIKKEGYYIVYSVRNEVAFVINAKRST